MPDHLLYPGNVFRSIVQEGDNIYVVTQGYGTGILPTGNALAAPILWNSVDQGVRDALYPPPSTFEGFVLPSRESVFGELSLGPSGQGTLTTGRVFAGASVVAAAADAEVSDGVARFKPGEQQQSIAYAPDNIDGSAISTDPVEGSAGHDRLADGYATSENDTLPSRPDFDQSTTPGGGDSVRYIRATSPPIISGAQIGAVLGSSLGNLIGGDNQFARIAAGSALSTVLGVVGSTFDHYFRDTKIVNGVAQSLSFEEAMYTALGLAPDAGPNTPNIGQQFVKALFGHHVER